MLTPAEVFVTDGFPTHTYVALDDGRQEQELREGLEQQNKIISISGPSKSGKTTLCDRVFGPSKGVDKIVVTGDRIRYTDDLWREAYRQVTDSSDRPYEEISHSQRLERIIQAGLPLIIDDYHYVAPAIQITVAQQIKNAASDGLRIVCLTVPHRGDDAIRSNPDLSGRFFAITFRYWEAPDLCKIAQTGFPLVGLPVVESFCDRLAVEALHSPQIMQTLCLEACRIHGQDVALENVHPSLESVGEIKRRTLRSYDNSSLMRKLTGGPPPHGKARKLFATVTGEQIDVYECIARALKLDPVFLHIEQDEIRTRIRSFLKSDQADPNARSALQQYFDVFSGKPPLDWDDEHRRLTVMDPHFYFYLRNA